MHVGLAIFPTDYSIPPVSEADALKLLDQPAELVAWARDLG
jgi:hypothetical protein